MPGRPFQKGAAREHPFDVLRKHGVEISVPAPASAPASPRGPPSYHENLLDDDWELDPDRERALNVPIGDYNGQSSRF